MDMNTRTKSGAVELAAKAIEQGKRWLLEREAAGYLSVTPNLMYQWRIKGVTSRGEKPPKYYQRGTQYYYSVDELDEWIRSGGRRESDERSV